LGLLALFAIKSLKSIRVPSSFIGSPSLLLSYCASWVSINPSVLRVVPKSSSASSSCVFLLNKNWISIVKGSSISLDNDIL
jgi:hypothetical protein